MPGRRSEPPDRRGGVARLGEDPVAEQLPQGIEDPDLIPVVGDNGWILITNDRRQHADRHFGGTGTAGQLIASLAVERGHLVSVP